MKLYTEEQVRKAYKDGNLDGFIHVSALDMCIDSLTPIELPSDEEIDKEASIIFIFGADQGKFIAGAKWVIEQIKQQDGRE